LPIATTAPFGIAAGGVVSRITVKTAVIFLKFFGFSRLRPDRGLIGSGKSSRPLHLVSLWVDVIPQKVS
jgi:hypothetical protein